MRRLLLLLVAACSSAPVTRPPTAAEPTQDPRALLARCPVGDLVNTTVYQFLRRELADAAPEDRGRAATRAALAQEAELAKHPDMKPLRASLVETETSNVLSTLCRGTPGCTAIGLYNASGLAIALSSLDDHVAPLGFEDARWAALTAVDAAGAQLAVTAAEAAHLAVDHHALIVFPAEHGLALCIIER
jgi:hypothetical protein